MFHKILVVGAGASGVAAAISAKDRGMDIGILEATSRIGNKLLTTGNGRCNITNKYINLKRYHSENPDFCNDVLNKVSLEDTLNFFYSLGLPIVELESGKMFPMSLQASSVLDILRLSLEERDIPIYFDSKIKDIKKTKNGFKILTISDEEFQCEKLIIACGGKSAANTGSDGSIYNIIKNLGHNIIPPIPALVQLKLTYKNLKALSGVKFDGNVEILIDNKLIKKDFGEVLFTDYGISGPPILQLSREASYALSKGKKVHIHVDMCPNYSVDEFTDFMENHWGLLSHRSVFNSLVGVINKKIIPILLKECNIDNIHKCCYDLTWKEKKSIIDLIKNWIFEVYDTNGFKNAQVTAGGVNTKEVSSTSLESKLIPNLYFCGEVLDVDGDCGGFNLQWAWSSGIVTACEVSK